MNKPLPIELLIAEDDPDDQLLISEALQEAEFPICKARFFEDGAALINFLENNKEFQGVILMDLNMPRMDGREALRNLKRSEKHKHIPIIVFTTSSSDEDVQLIYSSGGNTFFTKPSHFDELVDTMSLIKRYWIEKALLPHPPLVYS